MIRHYVDLFAVTCLFLFSGYVLWEIPGARDAELRHPPPPAQVSDDEDDTHPNIDTPSLFRWRHQARVQRTKELEEEKQKLSSQKNQ